MAAQHLLRPPVAISVFPLSLTSNTSSSRKVKIMMSSQPAHPVAVIGAGPVGLAAAAHLIARGITPLILEADEQVGANILRWGHVQFFTRWSYLLDPVSVALLEEHGGWTAPQQDDVPLARQLVRDYLDPIAHLPAINAALRLRHRVLAISRTGHDRMKDGERDRAPFTLLLETPSGTIRVQARAVIDASGTWGKPNPLGAAGIPADGEKEFGDSIHYGMPDIEGAETSLFAGKRTLVVGSGHSAIGSLLSLVALQRTHPRTQVEWAVRTRQPSKLWGGGADDELAERGALGTRVRQVVESAAVRLHTGMSIGALQRSAGGLRIVDVAGKVRTTVDRLVVATGCRPDFSMLGELRLEFDSATEASRTLGPLIDPNLHSCGSVRPHGEKELRHPEKDFYIVGMKSYGRAPTFLLRTGYEQVRSVAAFLAGDQEAAARVELVLPETGVCSTDLGSSSGAATASSCC